MTFQVEMYVHVGGRLVHSEVLDVPSAVTAQIDEQVAAKAAEVVEWSWSPGEGLDDSEGPF